MSKKNVKAKAVAIAKNSVKIDAKSSPKAAKKNIPIKQSKYEIVYGKAPKEYVFVLHDGSSLKNMKELLEALDTMSDETFYHHVNESNNDFSNWIDDVMGEKQLADELRTMRHRMETQLCMMKHVIKKLEKHVK